MGLIREIRSRKTTGEYVSNNNVFSLFGSISSAGVAVNEETSLRCSAVYGCIRVISETIASLPLFVYERLDKGKKRAKDHPLFYILHSQPNPEITSFQFRETLQAHLCLHGNAYAEIVWGEDGSVKELWPITPYRVSVRRDTQSKEIVYDINLPEGGMITLPSLQVLHIRGLSPNGLVGYSPIALAREGIGLALATEEYASRFFSNDASPGGVLEHPSQLTDKAYERLVNFWKEKHQGLQQAHRVAILEEGMKWQSIAIPAKDAQFIESRKFQVEEIARIFRVPPHLIASLDRATFCLPADVEVLTENGNKSIADIMIGEKVWSFDGNKFCLSTVKHCSNTGEDKILEIKTTNRTIRTNPKHRILVRRKYPCPKSGIGGYQHIEWKTEYVPASELKVGDTIVVPNKLPDTKNFKIPIRGNASIGFMEFCGLLVGDGNIVNGHITIARSKNASYMDYYRRVIKKEFRCNDGGNGRGNIRPKQKTVHLVEGERQTRFSSIEAVKELTALGFKGTAHTKQVPGWVFGLSDNLKLAFLRGFLDADGSVDKKGRISFSSCNQKLLSQIRHLCIGLGISVTNLRYQKGFTKLPNGRWITFEHYCFTCSNPADNLRIGSHTPEYIKRLKRGKPFKRKGRAYPRYGGKDFNLSDCRLTRINSIKEQASEAVYDLEVDGTHSFIANGIIVHNSNIEHQSIEFVTHCIRPWAVRWEQELLCQLFLPSERNKFFASIVLDGLLRGDTESRYRAYAIGRQWGWLSADDIRELEDMNPIEEGRGNIYLIPLNMMPAPKNLPESKNENSLPIKIENRDINNGMRKIRKKLIKSVSPLFVDVLKRIVKREEADIIRYIKKVQDKTLLNSFLDTFYEEHGEYVIKNMKSICSYLGEQSADIAADMIGVDVPAVDIFVSSVLSTFTSEYCFSAKKYLKNLLLKTDEKDILSEFEKVFNEWKENKTEKVKEHLVYRINNAVSLFVWKNSGVKLKKWVCGENESPFCQNLDGKVISIDSVFHKKGDILEMEGKELKLWRDIYHPPLTKFCSCLVEPVIENENK